MADGTIMALDIATKTGVAEGRPGEIPHLYTVDFGGRNDEPQDIWCRAVKWTATRLQSFKPDAIYIEASIPPSQMWGRTNHQTTLILIGLWAAIAGHARARSIPVRKVEISTARVHFLGRGNGRLPREIAKSRVIAMCELLGWSPPDDNAGDAGALWHFGCSQIAPELMTPTKPLFLSNKGAA